MTKVREVQCVMWRFRRPVRLLLVRSAETAVTKGLQKRCGRPNMQKHKVALNMSKAGRVISTYHVYIIKGSLVYETSVLRTFKNCSYTTHQYTTHQCTTHHTPLINTPFIIHHSSYTTHHTPLIIHHSSYTTHHTPLIIHHSSYTTHHTPLTIHHSSYTTHHTPLIIHH